jgi:hypothetical protein
MISWINDVVHWIQWHPRINMMVYTWHDWHHTYRLLGVSSKNGTVSPPSCDITPGGWLYITPLVYSTGGEGHAQKSRSSSAKLETPRNNSHSPYSGNILELKVQCRTFYMPMKGRHIWDGGSFPWKLARTGQCVLSRSDCWGWVEWRCKTTADKYSVEKESIISNVI